MCVINPIKYMIMSHRLSHSMVKKNGIDHSQIPHVLTPACSSSCSRSAKSQRFAFSTALLQAAKDTTVASSPGPRADPRRAPGAPLGGPGRGWENVEKMMEMFGKYGKMMDLSSEN